MFPLDTESVPTSAAEWRDVVVRSLGRWLAVPPVVNVEGEPPDLSAVDVNLSHGRLTANAPPDVTVVGRAAPGPTIERLGVTAQPLSVHGVPADLHLSARQVRLHVGRNAAGTVVLKLTGATDGRLSAHVAAADLDAALLIAARAGAAPHGVDVRSVRATLTAGGPRDLDVVLDVSAKKFMTFTVRVSGHLSVDDAMTARATRLTVDGTGMAAAFAAGVLRPQLQRLDGQPFPLLAYGPGQVRLHEVALGVGDGLRLTATFGGAA